MSTHVSAAGAEASPSKAEGMFLFEHLNICKDHVTMADAVLGGLVDVYRCERKLIVNSMEKHDATSSKFCYTLDEVKKPLNRGELDKVQPSHSWRYTL